LRHWPSWRRSPACWPSKRGLRFPGGDRSFNGGRVGTAKLLHLGEDSFSSGVRVFELPDRGDARQAVPDPDCGGRGVILQRGPETGGGSECGTGRHGRRGFLLRGIDSDVVVGVEYWPP